jgi:hypothetical protein
MTYQLIFKYGHTQRRLGLGECSGSLYALVRTAHSSCPRFDQLCVHTAALTGYLPWGFCMASCAIHSQKFHRCRSSARCNCSLHCVWLLIPAMLDILYSPVYSLLYLRSHDGAHWLGSLIWWNLVIDEVSLGQHFWMISLQYCTLNMKRREKFLINNHTGGFQDGD